MPSADEDGHIYNVFIDVRVFMGLRRRSRKSLFSRVVVTTLWHACCLTEK
jgi:hypothetical protein